MSIKIVQANYNDPQHSTHIIELLDCYATDPMGGNEALADYVAQNLVYELSQRKNALSILAYVNEQPAGLVNCFEGFSTFKCKPLINIHDMIVATEFRGLGLSTKMLKMVEEVAMERDCCKLTLEVLDKNYVAINSYKKFGFQHYQLDPVMGKAEFWEKIL
ncbi:MAG: GNAT family N-acetyltransferase [Gammaproteobacteria bacterium]|jgi:ribosomal protein S18 acetylase RimI-like enzyme|nr:GNAT family N-acetyltransferase [Xanthomonadales bacterium]